MSSPAAVLNYVDDDIDIYVDTSNIVIREIVYIFGEIRKRVQYAALKCQQHPPKRQFSRYAKWTPNNTR